MSGPGRFNPEQGPFAPGAQFQKFEIRRLIGRGGHAYVYHCYDQFLDRHVALKVIPDPIERGRDLQRRAQLEARVLCKLQHPNLVHVFDAGTIDDEIVYLVMELLEGRTLRDVFREFRSLSVAEVLRIGAQIADGVHAAHELNAIHRDLKPENVFVQAGNAIKVLDFGIAKLLGASNQTTQKDLLHGTMLYMSPEHLQGLGVTPRSDIYALGTILYEAIAGGPPCLLGVDEPTIRELAWIQIARIPKPLDELVRGIPHFVARGIQRMLAKDPAERFPTMAEVAALMRANLARLESESRGTLSQGRELWHVAPALEQELDTVAQTRPPFTVPPSSRDATPVIGESLPYPPLTRTLPLDASALQRELERSHPALREATPSSAKGGISQELVPTRTSPVAPSNEPTPMAADSPSSPAVPRVKVWTVVAAAVAVGTVAGLVAALGLRGRAAVASQPSVAAVSNSAGLEERAHEATHPASLPSIEAVEPPRDEPPSEAASGPGAAPSASAALAADSELPASAPPVAVTASASASPAPRPAKVSVERQEEARAGGAFSAALRASASAKAGDAKGASGPSSSRMPLPSELPGSGLDDPPPTPAKKKGRSSP
jgi:serine/threonine-protein kinase